MYIHSTPFRGLGFGPAAGAVAGSSAGPVGTIVGTAIGAIGTLFSVFGGGGPTQYQTEITPELQKGVSQTGRTVFSFWYGEVKGYTGSGQAISLGPASDVNMAVQMIQAYANSKGQTVFLYDRDQVLGSGVYVQFDPMEVYPQPGQAQIPGASSSSNIGALLAAGAAALFFFRR